MNINDLYIEVSELYNAGYISDEEREELEEALEDAEEEVEILNSVVKTICYYERRI